MAVGGRLGNMWHAKGYIGYWKLEGASKGLPRRLSSSVLLLTPSV